VVEAHLRQIQVGWSGSWRSPATRTRDEARARIEAALARLAAGEDFAAVAREVSDDPSGRQGGDLGVVAPGQLVPAFEDAAFALLPGQRSAVIETPYGFHVVERLP
jgi:peptidyl-prolyl cis-trans isomerase NIMA-interacting 1